MDIASLILSVIALLVSCSTLVLFLAKGVFSSHSIQMVAADSLIPNQNPGKTIEDQFEEFDFRSPMDAAVEELKKPSKVS